jgi:putative transposase
MCRPFTFPGMAVYVRRNTHLSELCGVLGVSVSGYRAWKGGGTADRQRLTDTQLLVLIQSIHAELKGAYGSPRMVRELRARGFSASVRHGSSG